MQRSLLVAAGTAAGVAAVVSYHAATPSRVTGLTASTPTTASRTSSTTTSAASATTPAARSGTSTSTTRAATTRSAVGEAVSFQYGEVQLKVTERAGRITNVAVASLDVRDPHSQSIDDVAVPQLREQVIAAQSAHIDGVSGASYTSQAYEESVQSALDKLT